MSEQGDPEQAAAAGGVFQGDPATIPRRTGAHHEETEPGPVCVAGLSFGQPEKLPEYAFPVLGSDSRAAVLELQLQEFAGQPARDADPAALLVIEDSVTVEFIDDGGDQGEVGLIGMEGRIKRDSDRDPRSLRRASCGPPRSPGPPGSQPCPGMRLSTTSSRAVTRAPVPPWYGKFFKFGAGWYGQPGHQLLRDPADMKLSLRLSRRRSWPFCSRTRVNKRPRLFRKLDSHLPGKEPRPTYLRQNARSPLRYGPGKAPENSRCAPAAQAVVRPLSLPAWSLLMTIRSPRVISLTLRTTSTMQRAPRARALRFGAECERATAGNRWNRRQSRARPPGVRRSRSDISPRSSSA
jgi:hypothetical protein